MKSVCNGRMNIQPRLHALILKYPLINQPIMPQRTKPSNMYIHTYSSYSPHYSSRKTTATPNPPHTAS